jgi:hypothetical protein
MAGKKSTPKKLSKGPKNTSKLKGGLKAYWDKKNKAK